MTTASYSTLLAVLLAFTISGCGTSDATTDAAPAVPPVSVAVVAATSGAVTDPVIATGTFGPRDEIPLSFKIGGVIAHVAVDQGTAIRKGQVLAALDLREIDAAVDKARVAVDKSTRDAARLQRLAADSIATLAQLQDANSALDAARADYQTARINREYATIVAPESGIVLQRPATAGTTIGAGVPVVTIGGHRRGQVLRAGISDRDALRLHVGDSARVQFDAVPDSTFTGVVSLIGHAADARTGTYTVEVQVRHANALPAGLVGRVEIAARARGTSTLVPVDALVEADADSATVYTVSSTTIGRDHAPTAEAHHVRITQIAGDRVAVTGIEPGARVITRGAAYLHHGSTVRIVPSTVTALRRERTP